jgi:hypothetical protein
MSILLQVRGGPDRVVEVRHRAHQEGEAVGGAEGAHARTGDALFRVQVSLVIELNTCPEWKNKFHLKTRPNIIEKIVIYLSENNEFRVCSFEEALVIVDQPIDGWYVRADALKIYLELGLLYDHYLTVPQLTESRFSFEAYSNKILQVAAMIIQIRLFGRSKIEYDLARMTVKNLSRVKAMYILIALYAPVFTLRIFRSVNTILVKA